MTANSICLPTRSIRKGKRHWLNGCAIAAGLMALTIGGPAVAQGVAGSGDVVLGNATIFPPALGAPANTTQVVTTTGETVINWTPTDTATTGGPIDFLAAGKTLEYYGSGQYTVLNRFTGRDGLGNIIPISRQVALNGTVSSFIGTPGGVNNSQGGNIWFYNAGGILIGSNAVINVGSLVLTANDIDTSDGKLFGPSSEIRFRGAAGSNSAVEIQSGAFIGASNSDAGSAYVAAVAPRIIQNGIVDSDGSTAYVAAEQADIRINGGLFDINVLVGTDGAVAIDHGGVTSGPSHQQGDANASRIYFVAIPKNEAITMLVSGQVGYRDAISAQTDPDGTVRLAAGYNIAGGEIDTVPVNATAANITVNDTLFLSSVVAHATGAFVGGPLANLPSGLPGPSAPPPQNGQISVQGDATFIGDVSATLSVGTNQQIAVDGDLTVSANGVQAGNATINVNGGDLTALGDIALVANGIPNIDGDSQAGSVGMSVNGGTISANNLTISADALGGTTDGGDGGFGRAGTATFTQTDGDITVGSLLLSASGRGGSPSSSNDAGGDGFGGEATLTLSGGTFDTASIAVEAAGSGGLGGQGSDFDDANAGAGGNGTGGTATIDIDGDAAVTTQQIGAFAEGNGGDGGNYFVFLGTNGDTGSGGDGIGGSASINLASGTLNTDDLTADASGTGGNGGSLFDSSSSGSPTGIGVGGDGGRGQGGTAAIGLAFDIGVDTDINSLANGTGGFGGSNSIGGRGGDADGGLAQFTVTQFDAGSLTFDLNAGASGGDGGDGQDGAGGDGGAGNGGTARLQVDGEDGNIEASQYIFGVDAFGGAGGNAALRFDNQPAVGPAGGNGGEGTGGTAEVVVNDGRVLLIPGDTGTIDLTSFGYGGAGGNGAANNGTVTLPGPDGIVDTADDIEVGLTGGDGGIGGGATGGTVRLATNGGTITSDGESVFITVAGESGTGGTGGTGSLANGSSFLRFGNQGGAVAIESFASSFADGQISLGNTTILANGDSAGRIELLTDSNIFLSSLNAQAFGDAAPTNNDTDTADAGIFLQADDGVIRTGSDMTLATDSSIGIYALAAGQVDVGNNLAIDAGDQVDIRHDLRTGSAPTVQTDGNLSIDAANSIGATPDSLLDAGLTLSLYVDDGDIDVGSLNAAIDTFIETPNGNIAVAGTSNSDGDLTVIASGTVDMAGALAGDDISISGTVLTLGNLQTVVIDDGCGSECEFAVAPPSDTFLFSSAVFALADSDPRLTGSSILLTSSGATTVEHAEAIDNFTAEVGSFATGLNSIITGGDISITAPGAIDLGNSTAGGFISASGESIAFNTLDAGNFVSLSAADTLGINGATINAVGDVGLSANRISITDAIDTGGTLSAFSNDGPIAIAFADAGASIFISANGDVTGEYEAGGNIELFASDNIDATARANGGFVDANGGTAEGNLFAQAGGNVTLTDSLAAAMFGVYAEGSANLTNVSAGEDMFVGADNDVSITNAEAGDDIEAVAAGLVTVAGADATGAGRDDRTLQFQFDGGFSITQGEGGSEINGADIRLESVDGAITASALSAADDIVIDADGTLTLNGATTLGLGVTGGDSSITTQSDDASFADLDAFDDIDINATGDVTTTGLLRAGSDIDIVAVSADFVTLPGSDGSSPNSLEAGDDLTVTTGGAISGGRAQAGGDLTMTGDAIDISRAATMGGGTVVLNGINGVSAGSVNSSGATQIIADSGAILVDALISADVVNISGDSVGIDGSGNLEFAQLDADVGDASVTSNGSIIITNGDVAGRAALTVDGGATLEVRSLRANDIDLSSTGNMDLVSVIASNSLTGSARGTLSVGGTVTGRTIDLSSGDISIDGESRIGTAGETEALTLSNTNRNAPTFVGGTGTRNGYHLDADEMTRLFGRDITIFADRVRDVGEDSVGSSAPPDLVIDDFTITAGTPSSNIGSDGTLTFLTPGKARVIGDVAITGASDANGLTIDADDALEVIMGTGSIRLTGSSATTPAGMLRLRSADVIVATLDAIADVGVAASTDDIDARLALNDGVEIDDGALFAGGIDVRVGDGFYVQNSGTGTEFDQRRGLTFGALGLYVGSSGTITVVINGVQRGPNGLVTGVDVIPLLEVGGGAVDELDPRSTLNGCLIASVSSCGQPPPPEVEIPLYPVQDIIEENEEGKDDKGAGNGSIVAPLIVLRDIDATTGEPLLDDPVTGAGNDDLWVPPVE